MTNVQKQYNAARPSWICPAEMFRSGTNPEDAVLEIEDIEKGGTPLSPSSSRKSMAGRFTKAKSFSVGRTIFAMTRRRWTGYQRRQVSMEDGIMPYVLGDESVAQRV